MRKDYEKLFTYLKSPEPPGDLFNRVINRIQKERRLLILKRRMFIFSLSAVCSAIALIPAFKMVKTGFTESGFMQFFSLLFSDFKIVVAYGQNFILSLLETLPVMSLVILLVVVLVFLESLRFLTRDIKIIFTSRQIIKT
jgi:hypothetical protein